MARSRRQNIALGVMAGGVLALAIGGALGVIFGEDAPVRTRGETTTTTAPTTTLPSAAALGDVGRELDELIDAGRHVDHHAVYAVTDPELPEGLTQTVEVWRRGELFRSDIVERTGAGTSRQSAISGGAQARACVTRNGVETCNVVNAAPPDLPGVFVAALQEAGDDVDLEVRDDDVAGYVARCFEAEDVGELCLAEDGIMLRLELKGAVIEASRIVDDVPAAAFDQAG